MKKKFLISFLLGVLCFSIIGCKRNVINTEAYSYNYYETRSYLKKDSQWVYYMNLTYDKIGNLVGYNFNGINLKIVNSPDFFLPVMTKGKIVEKLKPECICLNYYQKYKNEYNMINSFFELKHFTAPITLSDLEGLNIDFYSKEDLVVLFNDALKINYKRKLGNYSFPLNVVTKENSNGMWHVVTDGSFGYIEIADIDFIFKNGEYLSDISKYRSFYEKIYKEVMDIEAYIIDKQEFYYKYNGDDEDVKMFIDDLLTLLESITVENYNTSF